jgi:hypothetical protein
MHSDWFNGIEILQGRWQHGEKVGYCYPNGLEKTLCKWDIYDPLVKKRVKEDRTLLSLLIIDSRFLNYVWCAHNYSLKNLQLPIVFGYVLQK